MRKIFFLTLLVMTLGSCNQEKIFPDYDYTAVYFPIQYPVRTLSLGNDRVDNSLDKELKFHIGVSIGGMYENQENWTVDFSLAPDLAKDLTTADGDTIFLLPSDYYTITPSDKVTIPAGSFNGLMEVQLTDDFLDDPLAYGHHYVIPLVINSTTADSILSGVPMVPDADKRVAADWSPDSPPRDFTLFMIKFVNPYHGKWLHRGADFTLDASGNPVDTIVYHAYYLVENKSWVLSTNGRSSVKTNGVGNKIGSYYGMQLNFDPASGAVSIDSLDSSPIKVWGTGESKWIEEGDEWGDEKRETIYLNYKYNDGLSDHIVFDTLVFRDRGIHYEEFIPVVSN